MGLVPGRKRRCPARRAVPASLPPQAARSRPTLAPPGMTLRSLSLHSLLLILPSPASSSVPSSVKPSGLPTLRAPMSEPFPVLKGSVSPGLSHRPQPREAQDAGVRARRSEAVGSAGRSFPPGILRRQRPGGSDGRRGLPPGTHSASSTGTRGSRGLLSCSRRGPGAPRGRSAGVSAPETHTADQAPKPRTCSLMAPRVCDGGGAGRLRPDAPGFPGRVATPSLSLRHHVALAPPRLCLLLCPSEGHSSLGLDTPRSRVTST